MFEQTSEEFRTLFLIKFIEQLIKNSDPVHLASIISKRTQAPKEKTTLKLFPMNSPQKKFQSLNIPEPRLPPNLQYLKPTPTQLQIDLEQLNPLIKDSAVKEIECHGPDEKIIVNGSMGTKSTNIILDDEEINKVIGKFARNAKIPVKEGVFKAVAGRLILLAITSKVIGSKFIIKKMLYSPNFS